MLLTHFFGNKEKKMLTDEDQVPKLQHWACHTCNHVEFIAKFILATGDIKQLLRTPYNLV